MYWKACWVKLEFHLAKGKNTLINAMTSKTETGHVKRTNDEAQQKITFAFGLEIVQFITI